MKQKEKEYGFSLVETIIALVVLLVGLLGAMSAISWGILYMQESEKRTLSKEYARSTMETIFSMRDLAAFDPQVGGVAYNWDATQIKTGSNAGVFLDGWNPIRESAGADGIYGTADDACAATSPCLVGTTTNNSPVVKGYDRMIEIFDITENGVVNKRRITVHIRYWVGSSQREETESTIVADLPTG
jgi:prepilin-type N-terminal cleavage/methylation domain-containing protein